MPARARSASCSRPTSCRRWSGCATASWSSRRDERLRTERCTTSSHARAPTISRRRSSRSLMAIRREHGFRRGSSTRVRVATMRDALAVWRKELIDALRDRRTLLMVLVSSVLLGPAVLVAVSSLVATLESTAERREVVVAGIDAAPSLRNFLERQTYRVRAAPANYETQLRRSTLADPVVVVPADFEAALRRGEAPIVEVVSDASNRRAQAGAGRIERLLRGFAREHTALTLALRGVSIEVLDPVQVESRDLASAQSRA